MYNPHNYLEEFKTLHIVTYERNYIDNMHSNFFFFVGT